MRVFVINLERSSERRESIKRQLVAQDVDYEIIKAVDGATLTDEYIQIALNHEEVEKRPYLKRRGAYGCALSHYSIYLKMVAENIPYALVLEDDVVIEKGFKSVIDTVASKLVANEVVLLFAQNNFMPIVFSDQDTERLPNDRRIVYPMEPWALGSAAGYIVTNEAARGLMQYVFPVREPADAWIAFYREKAIGNIRCITPFVVKPAGFDSNIDYVSSQSLVGKVFSFVKKYRIFPFKQLLDYRRKRMLINSSAYSFTPERSPVAVVQQQLLGI
ncbi:glycosyltransferase family 25 protein [Hymenobacter sp. BT770]|uniref:glycosyltransferase family 25 protein n=1 Tax=Hymenobacter sp. BT770 TaxID=2886942 RepID=UPI001D11ED8A|nr:glycosyltransferase family 25 protein [Hymenobacter sp. BT770]MCC3155078.1 glycosyltransferase family 25 protein [Hymenobacter sp. BT770]MDO3417021.1 glycosyltransferase family 25 protein [Hymenobacter sp. BT770]